MTDSAEHHLQAHDDEDSETGLGVRAVKMGAGSDFNDDENHGDEHDQERGDLDVAMQRKPFEEGTAETTKENGCRHKDEPSYDH